MGKNTIHTEFNSPNYTANAQVAAVFGIARSIDFITIHWWGDPNQNPTWEGVVSWLCQARSQVSAHDVVTGTGRRVAVLVNYYDAAWHTGSARGNATSLGHELDPRARQEDYDSAAENIADTWKYYGRIIPLRAHNSWMSTQCPGVYDLNRLHAMALALYNGTVVAPVTTDQIKQAYLDILKRPADAGGINTYLKSGYDINKIRSKLLASPERKDLEAREAAEAAKAEWVRNIAPYTPGDVSYAQSTALTVIPAEGVKVYDLSTGKLLNSTIIPKGTQVDIIAKTTVKGIAYLISRYSKDKGLANGIIASGLAVPAEPPVQEKPEWLKNLQDIADKDMWTRSETPVLNLADGTVRETLAINTKVRITHATQIVGKDLLVLDGQSSAIETVYLSDTPIKNPDSDVEKRLSALESIVKTIVDFLTSVFKGFNK